MRTTRHRPVVVLVGGGGHTNPDFGDAKVYFYDENGVWRYVLMNDVKDEKKLGYQYSSLMRPTEPPRNLNCFH